MGKNTNFVQKFKFQPGLKTLGQKSNISCNFSPKNGNSENRIFCKKWKVHNVKIIQNQNLGKILSILVFLGQKKYIFCQTYLKRFSFERQIKNCQVFEIERFR